MFESFKGLMVRETIWLNTLRSFGAGIVWFVLSLFIANDANTSFYMKFLWPFAAIFVYWLFFFVAQLLKVINLEGIGSIMCMLFSTPGDPLVHILFKIKPEFVPVEKFNILNFVGIILVYKNDIPAKASAKKNIGNVTCTYSGKIIGDKEGTVLGFSWPTKGTIFSIDEDWNVLAKGASYGWIDKNGQIREGLKGNPDATLSPGKIIGRISNNTFYINENKIGTLVPF